jgi:hypothetical protein
MGESEFLNTVLEAGRICICQESIEAEMPGMV